MTRKLRIAVVAGAVAALAFPAFSEGTAVAQSWKPTVFKVNDPDPNDLARINNEGRLRKTDEEFTNEMGVVKFFGNGTNAIYVEMRTGALLSGEEPIHNMQGACSPMELVQNPDGSVGFVKLPGEKFISDNDGNEYRNFNKPELMVINGGKNMLVMFNYQPNNGNDTKRYAKVLDQNCNEITVKNANGEVRKQVLIMAKNNDDCDMHQSGEGPCDLAGDVGGVSHLTCWAGCNGNGEDDGWINDVTVSCINGADGSATECTIKKNFDLSLCQREERSRGRCSIADEDPNTAICTWTEGNNQPQRDGTWIAAVDISAGGEQGEDADSRLLWKEQIDGRKDAPNGDDEYRTYSVRAKHTRMLVPATDGSLTRSNMIMFMSGDLQGRNRDDKKGGTYRAHQIAVIKATAAGMEYVMPLTNTTDMLLGIDGTHLTLCGAVFGEGADLKPGMTLLQGSHNGGGVTEPIAKAVAFDIATNRLIDLGSHRVGGSYDRHLYSNYLGNNPGNQGRNFAGCELVKNPYVGVNGNTSQYFIAHAMTGKSPENVGNAALKPSSYVTLLPVATQALPASPPAEPPPTTEPPTTPPPTGGTGTGTGTGTGAGTGTEEDPPSSGSPPAMGCSTTPGGTGAGGLLVGFSLLGLALVQLISRRRS